MSKKSVKFTLMSNSHQLILLDGSAFLFRAYFSTIAQNLTNDEGFPTGAMFGVINASFELQQGEFLTIIGPNGAGKSSLIKVLLGLIKADSGNIKRAKKLKLGYNFILILMSKKSVKFTLMPNPHQLILLDGSAFLFRAYFSTIAQNLTNDEGFPTGAAFWIR
jgi:predicted ribosome-associated RNA-binding protein Tma20